MLDPRYLKLALKQQRNYHQRTKNVKMVEVVGTKNKIEKAIEDAQKLQKEDLTDEQYAAIENRFETASMREKQNDAKRAAGEMFTD